MGEAKRRREYRDRLLAQGGMAPRPERCPACGSARVIYVTPETLNAYRQQKGAATLAIDTSYAGCVQCRAIWEPFPPLYAPDEVEAEPCDNCAFRPNSPEQKDPETWRELIEKLRPDGKGWFRGKFYCHKNVPLDIEAGAGNFIFPKLADGTPDERRMRTCSGFLRMFWALAKKTRADGPEDDLFDATTEASA